MMVLRDAILELLERAKKWPELNEQNTKVTFIEHMLDVLGWDVADPDVVTREYRVYDGTLIDYALKVDGAPRMFIEAKSLGRSLDDKQFIAQTVNYANNEGIVWCVLTNGLKYRVYKTNEPSDMERKLLFDVDLNDAAEADGGEEVARRLTFLSRESIESGSLDEWGESAFTDARVKSALTSLLGNPPLRLVNLVLASAAGGAGLTKEKVKDSLRRAATLLSGNVVASPAARSSPRQSAAERPAPVYKSSTAPQPAAGWTALDRLEVSSRQAHPAQLRLPDGTTHPLNAWNSLLIEVTRYLIRTQALGPQHCPVSTRPSNKRFLVHTDALHPNGKRFFAPVQVDGLWLETHASAKDLHKRALFLIGWARLSPGSFLAF